MFSSSSSYSSSSSVSFLKPLSKKAFFPTRISASFSEKTENRATLTMASSSVSPYEILGISVGATCHEIKAAYRRLARTCHPDVVGMKQKETSASEFMKIHSAYSTLLDPDKRARCDREIRRKNLECSPLTSKNVDSMSGYGYGRRYAFQSGAGMKWETDQCW